MSGTIEQRATTWAANGSGASAKAIFGVMTGNPPADGFCYPHDGDDFSRCHKLLALIPEWRARLGEMATIGPEWAALASHWDELDALYVKGAHDALYKRMKEILNPVEADNPALVKFGRGALYMPGLRRRR
jgi:hypothetical protein